MGTPEPLKIRPNMSSETAIRRSSPVNWTVVFLTSMPEVPSKTCCQQRSGGNDLDNGLLALNFEYLSKSCGSVWKRKVDNFAETRKLHVTPIIIERTLTLSRMMSGPKRHYNSQS